MSTEIDNKAYDVGNGKVLYDNAPTVCCVALVSASGDVLMVKRKNSPCAGKWALPGGFQMRGETIQQAGAREILEETGVALMPEYLDVRHIETDKYGHNVIILGVRNRWPVPEAVLPSLGLIADDDAAEAAWMYPSNISDEDLAFPIHTTWARDEINRVKR